MAPHAHGVVYRLIAAERGCCRECHTWSNAWFATFLSSARLRDLPGGDDARLAALAGPLGGRVAARSLPPPHVLELAAAILRVRGIQGAWASAGEPVSC